MVSSALENFLFGKRKSSPKKRKSSPQKSVDRKSPTRAKGLPKKVLVKGRARKLYCRQRRWSYTTAQKLVTKYMLLNLKARKNGVPQIIPPSCSQIIPPSFPQIFPPSFPQIIPPSFPQIIPPSFPQIFPQTFPQTQKMPQRYPPCMQTRNEIR